MVDADPTPAPPEGLLAAFDSSDQLLAACRRMREAGYLNWDAHAPYPVHGLGHAMGLRRSVLPWVVFVMALTGAAGGFLLQAWIHAVAYPLVIGAKPFFSWQAFIPVTFELCVLFGALGAVFGLLALTRLPRLHNWLFASQAFERVSDDRFFVSVNASDALFDETSTAALLRECGACSVELVRRS